MAYRKIWVIGLLNFLILCMPVQNVSAQWAVVDLAQVANSARQIIIEYNTFLAAVEQVKNQVKNLQRIDEALVMITTIMTAARQLDEMFNRAQAISFTIGQVDSQFSQLYRQRPAFSSLSTLLAYKQRLLGVRLEASNMAMSMQAVRTNILALYTNISALLAAVWTASGALDMAQLHAQQNALHLHAMQQKQAMDATDQRLRAMREAEDVANAQMAVAWHQQVTTPSNLGDWREGPQLSLEVKGSLN